MSIGYILSICLVGGVYLSGLLAVVWCALRAPEGYEDTDGFHLGRKPRPRSFAGGDPAEKEWDHAA